MGDEREVLRAEELDAMSPNERAAAFEERVVRDLDELPADFRAQVMATGERLAKELGLSPAGE